MKPFFVPHLSSLVWRVTQSVFTEHTLSVKFCAELCETALYFQATRITKSYLIYNGIFPCFLFGTSATLVFKLNKPLISLSRVSAGKITSST